MSQTADGAPPVRPTRLQVRPRDAASLILLRPGSDEPEVLMGRRVSQHKFLPDLFVFPGGGLSSSDMAYSRSMPLFLKGGPLIANSPKSPGNLAALGVAALRETYEETGICLGRVHRGLFEPDLTGLTYLGRAITPSESPIRFHARFFLKIMNASPVSLGGSGELTDLAFRPLSLARQLPLADITEFLLGALGDLPPDLRPTRSLFWRYREGKPLIRWS